MNHVLEKVEQKDAVEDPGAVVKSPALKTPHALAQAIAWSIKCWQAASLIFPALSTENNNELGLVFADPTIAE